MDINEYILNKPDDVILIDVRSVDEYKSGFIKGAINIPLDIIENVQIDISKESKIYVYCHSGRRSEIGKNILVKRGYMNVTNIGGIMDFKGKLVI